MGLPFIGDIIKGATGIIDELHTSGEEKLAAKTKLTELHTTFATKILKYEQAVIESRSAIIQTEAASTSWLARSWRPITMLTFVLLIVTHWLGYTTEKLTEAEILSLLGLVKIGLGGYIAGRSAEKIVPSVLASLKKQDKV